MERYLDSLYYLLFPTIAFYNKRLLRVRDQTPAIAIRGIGDAPKYLIANQSNNLSLELVSNPGDMLFGITGKADDQNQGNGVNKAPNRHPTLTPVTGLDMAAYSVYGPTKSFTTSKAKLNNFAVFKNGELQLTELELRKVNVAQAILDLDME